MSIIKAGMQWPPENCQRYKIKEHSAWFSGDPDVIANFYAEDRSNNFLNLTFGVGNKNSFWRRQIKNDTDFYIHVPIANDIAETSAAFLFGESPLIRFADTEGKPQEELDKMLVESGLFRKLLEGAEIASGLGGVFVTVNWDSDLSPYPIPSVVQPDDAFPEFKFGKLVALDVLVDVYKQGNEGSKYYRLFERREKGSLSYKLFEGSADRLGEEVPLDTLEETKDLEEFVKVPDMLFAVYVPNMLPNRIDRRSPHGRADIQGLESLMDALDETFSNWMIDIQFARGKIHLPEDYLSKDDSGNVKFNVDKNMYVKLDVDPAATNNTITVSQFSIRATEFETTILNLLDRIITSAGYSPQSFGLNISGRAESGTALNVRERKSFSTTGKKQAYWEQPIKELVKMMVIAYNSELGGKIVGDVDQITVEFCDSVSNNLSDVCTSIKMLSDAKAASTETKVRMAHPEWSDSQVNEEVEKIDSSDSLMNPDGLGLGNPDLEQMKQEIDDEEGMHL